LLPELYLHGLALGDFDLALRGLLGEDAPLSATTVSRLKETWHAEQAQWASRPLADLEVVYLWVDGVYVKPGWSARRRRAGRPGCLADGRKELVTLVPGHRESTGLIGVLRDLEARGLVAPKLVIGDGHLGIWAGLRNVYPTPEQRCWNHRIVNALDKVPKRPGQAGAAHPDPYADTAQDGALKAGY
jgi:transposase-like protein